MRIAGAAPKCPRMISWWKRSSRHLTGALQSQNLYLPTAEVDYACQSKMLNAPNPEYLFVMYFTPRSGSSWVADIASRSKRFGQVTETFNPRHMGRMTKACQAPDLDTYCEIFPRRLQRNGVLGFQVTHHQIARVFGSDQAFLDRYGAVPAFWLIRQDIILQAISLHKMVVTGFAHTPHTNPLERAAAEDAYRYDSEGIRRWLLHILAAEENTDSMFERAGIDPMRMSYEQNVQLSARQLLSIMSRHIGMPHAKVKRSFQTKHEMIRTDRNHAFAAQFREENTAFVEEIEDRRKPRLDRLTFYGPERLRSDSDNGSDNSGSTL